MKKLMGWLLVLSVGMMIMGCSEEKKTEVKKTTETKETKTEKKDK